MSEPKVVSLNGLEIDAVITALNVRIAVLIQATSKTKGYPMTEIDLLDDVIEKIRETT